ncbi:COX15/CtaA family protein [Oerskovia turbata]
MSSAELAPSPAWHAKVDRFRRWTRPVLVANLVAQIGIIVTGGAVRLTGSGLGCSTWPLCEPGSFTPEFHSAMSIHPIIEFGNRTLTGILGIIAVALLVLVWTDSTRSAAYRRLAWAPIGGVALQAVIGGVTVLLHLHPAVVGVHFLVSAVLVWVSAYLLYRHGEGDGQPVTAVDAGARVAGRVLAALSVPVLVLGVLATGSGPHGGDDDVAYRFALDPALISKVHAVSVWLFLVVLVVLAVRVFRQSAPARARKAVVVLIAVTLAQGLIGYVQYFTGLPIVLVAMHLLGAGVLITSLTWTLLTFRVRD